MKHVIVIGEDVVDQVLPERYLIQSRQAFELDTPEHVEFVQEECGAKRNFRDDTFD